MILSLDVLFLRFIATSTLFLEKGMATHSRSLAWRISWTEETGELQFPGWQRVGHD